MTVCAGSSRLLGPVSFKLLDASVGPDQLPQLGPGREWSSEAVHWQSPAPDTEPVAAPALKVGPEPRVLSSQPLGVRQIFCRMASVAVR